LQASTTKDHAKEEAMQYVLLIYQGTTPLPSSEAWALSRRTSSKPSTPTTALSTRPPGVTPGLPLGLPENAHGARAGRQGAGQRGTPSSERAAFAVGGYFIFEADDLDAAIELAARIPAARLGGAIEVRPVGTYW
jgi:hypothetical protein